MPARPLADDRARHPLRRRFPRFFEDGADPAEEAPAPAGGLKMFAMSFAAFFTLFYGMIL